MATIWLLASPAAGQDMQKGLAAYQRGDYAAALREIRPSAEQGLAEAQNKLGLMYDIGSGVTQDFTEAVKWYRRAAEQGQADAQFSLGYMYDNGEGAPRDLVQAVTWYRRAAEQGVAGAQLRLGHMYSEGKGAPSNRVLAHLWLNLAAASHKLPSVRELAAGDRERVTAKMNSAELAEAERLARQWKPRTWAEVQSAEREAGQRR